MSISELFIRRPVMTTLVMSGVLLFGVLGYTQLPVSDLPTTIVVANRTIASTRRQRQRRASLGKSAYSECERIELFVVPQAREVQADR